MKVVIFAILVVGILTRSYPFYKQCDTYWAHQKIGNSSKTICSAGSLMTSASMALAGTIINVNPITLNTWLTQHGGYVSGDLFVWSSINPLGLVFEGKVGNSQIKAQLDAGKVVICNVHHYGHWVLAFAYNGDKIFVNDPTYSTISYTLSQFVDGQNGIYRVESPKPSFFEKFKRSFLRPIGVNTKADGTKLELSQIRQA